MSKSTPAAPDYRGAAQEQAASSAQQTEANVVANRPTINTPFGQQSWQLTPVVDPVTGQTVSSWTQNTTLTPAEQQALDAQQQIQLGKSAAAQSLLDPFGQAVKGGIDFSGLPQMGATPDQTTTAGGVAFPSPTTTNAMPSASMYDTDAANAAFKSFMGMQQPLMDQAKSQLDTQLQNQGLKPGDQAYDTAMRNLENQQSQAVNQAGYSSILTGAQIGGQQQAADLAAQQQMFGQGTTQAQQTLAQQQQAFGQALQRAGYQSNLSQSALAQKMQEQGFNLNEINAILSGAQVGMPSAPSFSQAGTAQPVQALTAAQNQGQSMLDQYNASQQQTAGLEQGAGTLALAAMFF